MRKIFSTIVLIMLAVPGVWCRSAEEFFKSAPSQVLPLLDNTARLDMLDYYNSSLSKPTGNNLGGGSVITGMSEDVLDVKLTEGSTVTLFSLPAERDTLVGVISTILTPVPDSRMVVYSGDWKRDVTAEVFAKPDLERWLTGAGKKSMCEVQRMVPFLLIGYAYDPGTKTLRLTNNTRQFMGEEIYTFVSGYLLGELVYRWDGKRFVKQK